MNDTFLQQYVPSRIIHSDGYDIAKFTPFSIALTKYCNERTNDRLRKKLIHMV